MRACIATAALAIAASACGGSSKSGSTPTSAQPSAVPSGVVTMNTPVPGSTYVPPTPTVLTGDNKTAIAAKGAVEMVDFTDAQGRFTIKAPRGWIMEPSKTGFVATLPGDPIAAQVGVFCSPDKKTVVDLEHFDQALMNSVNVGTIPFDQAVPVKVGNIDAVSIRWTGYLQQTALDRVFVYFVTPACAWRLQMTTWPGLTTADLAPILNAMMTSFALKG